ncbi:MAG: replicative DNA helicase [Clostridia bacterium]|nr:replicative DNA helicase [Clostridia bacterium]MBR2296708.1 replicative DNA helicase [Clostridia bacterium]
MDGLQRKLPFSVDAEQSVLGSILIDPNCFNDVAEIVSVDDFYIEEHKRIFEIMLDFNLRNKIIDLVTLLNEMVSRGVYNDDAEARAYIRVIAEVVPSAQNAKDYAKIVHDKSILRKLIEATEEIQRVAFTEGEDVAQIVDLAERKIYEIAGNNERHDFAHIREVLVKTYEHLNMLRDGPTEDALGIQTGFSELDNTLVGLNKGNLIIVGARPGVGKTSFALNIGASVAKRTKKAVCIFSLEMSNEELVSRIISSEAMVDSQKLRKGDLSVDDWEKLAVASSLLSETDIYIDDTTGISLTSMKAKLRRVKNLGLVIVDYLQLMQPERRGGDQNRVNQIGEISRGLKVIAKELGVPVMVLSQLARAAEKEKDRPPMLSDLRDSGSIEQDADMVIFLSRDYYGLDPEKQNIVDVIVAKNRHGSTGKVTMSWLGQYTKFSTLDRDTAQRFGIKLDE